MVSNCTIGLANWTKMVLPVFRVTYHTGRDQRVPPFNFFRHCATFFQKKISPQEGPPFNFLEFCNRMDVEKSQRVPRPFSFFSALRFFPEKKKKSTSSTFSCFATEWMLKNLKGSPISVFRHCETLARPGLALAGPGAPFGPFFWVCNFFEKKIRKIFDFRVL